MPWPAKTQAAWNQSDAPDGSHRSTDQKDAGDTADRAEHLERVPHACHTPRCPAVSQGHSRALTRRLPGLPLSQVTQ
jgi:hypothetical protein